MYDHYNMENVESQTEKQPENNRKSLSELLLRAAEKTGQNERLYELSRDVMSQGRRDAAYGCGRYITLLSSADMQDSRIETAYFCRNRLCPGCAWRKTAKDAIALHCILQQAVQDGYTLVFATMTARTVPGSELREAIEDYDKAYYEMMKRGKFAKIPGAIRRLEVTYNPTTQEYHPHIHSVWLMPKGWRKTTHPVHITKTEMVQAWREALQYKYATSAAAQDIRTVKTIDRGAVAEFSKYVAKSYDYLRSKQVFETFYTALRGIRILTYMKQARKYKKSYKDGLLNQHAEPDTVEYYVRTHWTWAQTEYELYQLDRLETPETFAIIDTDETIED